MKLEYLYTDDSYKAIISKLSIEKITLSEKEKDKLFIFSYDLPGENEETAKELSELHTSVFEKLENKKLFILTNEAAEYFDGRLYPLINKFERLFRKAIALIANKNANEKAIEYAKKLEQLEFGDIYKCFFTGDEFVSRAKSLINNGSLSKKDLIEKIKEQPEKTLWGELFGNNYSEIPNSFYRIKDARNAVMHAHNISYSQFTDTAKLLKNANVVLNKIIDDIVNDKAPIAYPKLTALFDALSKIPSESMMIKTIQENLDKLQESLRNVNIVENPLRTYSLDIGFLNTSDTQITDLSDKEKKDD